MLIKGYNKDSNITIMNNMYHYPRKDEEGNLHPDTMTIVYKDNETGKKGIEVIKEPKYTYYKIKPEFVKDYPQVFIERSKCDPITVPFHDLEKSIAEELNMKEFFYDNIRSGNRRANQILHTHPSLMSSDININNYYRKLFDEQYQNPTVPVTKAYLDIEVDGRYMVGDFPQPGECPVNAISMFNEVDNTLYTFTFRDSNNPQVAKFEEYIASHNMEQEFKEFLFNNVGGWKKAYRMHLKDIKVKVVVFDDELTMLVSMFNIINHLQPDFVLAWNMAFDIPYLIQRFINLGYDPADIICHPDFEEKHCYYKIDKDHEAEFAQRGDYADISSYSVYLDQMIEFASRRKGQSAFATFGLDYIGGVVAGARKLDYHDITNDIVDFPYLDFVTFIKYNMMDVMVQKCIEEKTGDINYVFNKAIVNDTMYPKVHRQTMYLANRASKFMLAENDLVMGNNCNKFKEKPNEKFPGAFVAALTQVTDKPKVKVNGKPIMLVKNANDFDYKRLYPSIMQEFNICTNGQIGRMFIDKKIHDKENLSNNPKFFRTTAFFEDYCACDYISFGHRWFHLASFEEMMDDVREYFETHNSVRGLREGMSRGKKEVLRFWHNNEKFTPLRLVDSNFKKEVITIYQQMPKDVESEYKRIIKEVMNK